MVLPELELQKVASLPYRLQVFPYPENPSEWDNAFRKAAQALSLTQSGGKRIGVDPRQLRLLEFRHVKVGAPEADYPDGSDVLSSLRLKKEKTEVEAMRRAVKIAQEALEATIPSIEIGMTEKELSSEIMISRSTAAAGICGKMASRVTLDENHRTIQPTTRKSG